MPKDELPKIIVKNSGLTELFVSQHPDRGLLVAGEVDRHVPFAIRRFYFITGFKDKAGNLERGQHAHKQTKQVIFCLSGSFKLKLDDGQNRQEIVLDDRSFFGVHLGERLWHSMTDFSPDCVILVVADNHYDENDYLRDYDEFLSFIAQNIDD